MKRKILLGLTTTEKSDWRQKTEEIKKFKLEEVALFPTFLQLKKRKELYKLLERTGLKRIPHVHLRDDMETWEIEYFFKKYHTRLFNIHYRDTDKALLDSNASYAKYIYVENLFMADENFLEVLSECAGICLDASHHHDLKTQSEEAANQLLKLFEENKIGCAHISAIWNKKQAVKSLRTGKIIKTYSAHYMNSLSELDYVKKYASLLPPVVSIELENSFEEQLEVQQYLDKIINCA